jgi:hypothetical protein
VIGKGRDQRVVGPGGRREAKRAASKMMRQGSRMALHHNRLDPAEGPSPPKRVTKGYES